MTYIVNDNCIKCKFTDCVEVCPYGVFVVEKITDADWEESMFSLGTYTERSATGGKVYGSMHDYYKEISYGKLKLDGKSGGVKAGTKVKGTTIAELGNGSLGVVDLARGAVLKRIGGLSEPQGVAYLAAADTVYVASGGDGNHEYLLGASLD